MIDVYGWIRAYTNGSFAPYRVVALQLKRLDNQLIWNNYLIFCSPLPNIWALEVDGKFDSASQLVWEELKRTHHRLSEDVFYFETVDSYYIPANEEDIWKLK